MRYLLVGLLLALGGCTAAQPANIQDACAIFREKGGWFDNWHRHARRSEREFGVPIPVMMATIYKESSFRARAKPPRRRLLGVIPWRRPSNAYGYAQALKGTWAEYREQTGRRRAKRHRFRDAVHFVGWYHHQSHRRNGIALDDAYNLYLSYYAGPTGYARGVWKSSPHMQTAAANVASMTAIYRRQLASCDL